MRAGSAQLGERLSVLGAIFPAPPGQAHNSLWSLGSHRVTTGSQMWPIWNLLPTLLALTGLVATACVCLSSPPRGNPVSLSPLLVPLSASTSLRLPSCVCGSSHYVPFCTSFDVPDFWGEHLVPSLSLCVSQDSVLSLYLNGSWVSCSSGSFSGECQRVCSAHFLVC